MGLTVAVAAAGTAVLARGDVPPVRRPAETAYQRPAVRPDVEQRPDGTWASYLLPFAGPFPTREAAQRAVDETRRDGLIR